MRFIYFLLFTLVLFSCNRKQTNTVKVFLNEQQLVHQFFNVNINSDTTLITKSGCIIKIPGGSLQSDSTNVELEIKEAITFTDIVLAGMTTQSNRQSLSSGGMIYFNAASGYKISIKKTLEILVPTNTYNRDMKVYTGEGEQNDEINWKDPTPLPKDSTTQKIDEGETLFKSNCANCHKIYDDFTGPALYGVTDRRTKKWLYNFTRRASDIFRNEGELNDSGYYYDKDPYTFCLRKAYGSIMPSFSNLSNDDLNRLYGYIQSESDKRPDLSYKLNQTCCDSCETYRKKISELNRKKENLINENEGFFNLERIISIPPATSVPTTGIDNIPTQIAPYSKITPLHAKAVYYTINISAVGWYNIDILMKELSSCKPSELFVRMQGGYRVDLNIVLIIPAVKAFVEGGKLKNDKYGFDESDGKIPLPQNTQSYILAFGEYDNKIIFGKTIFSTQLKQTINITVEQTTKEKMVAEIKALKLDDVNTTIQKSKIAEKIIETNKRIKEAEKLKPKNCDCDLGHDYPRQPIVPLQKNP